MFNIYNRLKESGEAQGTVTPQGFLKCWGMDPGVQEDNGQEEEHLAAGTVVATGRSPVIPC